MEICLSKLLEQKKLNLNTLKHGPVSCSISSTSSALAFIASSIASSKVQSLDAIIKLAQSNMCENVEVSKGLILEIILKLIYINIKIRILEKNNKF